MADHDGFWQAWREHRKVQQEAARKGKAERLATAVAVLNAKGIPWYSNNGGVHMIVAERFDFWPTTGLWMERTGWSQPEPDFANDTVERRVPLHNGLRGRGLRYLLEQFS